MLCPIGMLSHLEIVAAQVILTVKCLLDFAEGSIDGEGCSGGGLAELHALDAVGAEESYCLATGAPGDEINRPPHITAVVGC